MEIFPEFDDNLIEEFAPDDSIDLDEEVQPPVPYGFTWRFDYDTGDIYLSPAGETSIADGIEAVREWIRHTLSIERFESPAYGTDIGTDLGLLIGMKNRAFAEARIRTEIEEALLAHDRILTGTITSLRSEGGTTFVEITFETDDSAEETLTIPLG